MRRPAVGSPVQGSTPLILFVVSDFDEATCERIAGALQGEGLRCDPELRRV